MKMLLALNSFKECCSSVNASISLNNHINNSVIFPLSDGGDGFIETVKYHFGLESVSLKIEAINSKDLIHSFAYDSVDKSFFLSSSDLIGMRLISKDKRNPMEYNTKSLGILLSKIIEDKMGARKIVVGIGGTATNDLGLGLCSAFGLVLKDANGNSLPALPKYFIDAADIEWHKPKLSFQIIVVTDVNNPLLGDNGAVKTYSKQKGASEKDIVLLEKGFENIINILIGKKLLNKEKFLSGAGGGLAAGLQIFFDAQIETSKDFILKRLGLEKISYVDYVITGEGSFDEQSLMDKATGVVIDHFKDKCKKIFIICGSADKNIRKKLSKNIKIIELSSLFETKEESIKNFDIGLAKAAEIIKKSILS